MVLGNETTNFLKIISIVFICFFGLMFGFQSYAQTPGPVQLVPKPKLSPPIQRSEELSRSNLTTNRGLAVEIGKLKDVDPSVAGLLDEINGGLGLNMWAGSNRSRIEHLLRKLPMGTLSPVIQDLARRLLLSTAAVPSGEKLFPSLLGIRVERLMAGGHIEEVNELLELAAIAIDDPALSRAEVDALLLAGDNAGACNRVSSLVRSDSRPYWIKTIAFCKALENDKGAVSLALALLRDQGHIGDEVFFSLINDLIEENNTLIETLIDPEPLHLAMLRAAQQTIPADAVAGARPSILWAIATAPNDELVIRVEAAERAESAGALGTKVLADIYSAVPYTPEEIDLALQTASVEQGPMTNALLYQAAMIWESDAMRATALQRAWHQARKSGAGFGTSARVSIPIIREIKPHPDLIWFVHDVTRALITGGEVDLAWEWLRIASFEGESGNLHAQSTADSLWPLLQMADPEGAYMQDSERARSWWNNLGKLNGSVEFDKLALLFTLYEALGDGLPDSAWDPLFAAPLTVTSYQPSPAVSHALREASEAGRLAETVLLSLVAMGDIGSEGSDSTTLFNVIQALRKVGLASEARSIALEAALARGL